MSEPEVVGIDAGGTKTHLAVAGGRTADGTPLITAERVVATSLWRTGEPAPDATALAAVISAAFGPAALEATTVIGAHGCDSTLQCRQVETALGHAGLARVRVLNDAELMPATAAVGADLGTTAGIGLVCGTGSIAVTRDAAGSLLTSGGWGWVLGDEGSAAGLVREAARAVLTGLDEGRGADPLRIAMFAAFDVEDGPELAMALSRHSDAAWWGSHAPAVFGAADAGSAAAAGVIDDGGAALALLVDRLLARTASHTPTGEAAPLVVAGGSVILGQQRLRSAFTAALAARHPEVPARFLERPPVIGALNLATAWAALGADPVAGRTPVLRPVPAAALPPRTSPTPRPPQLPSEVRP